MNFNSGAIVPLGILAVGLGALWHFGGAYGKGMALGVAGVVLANQIPVVNQGLNARLLTQAAA